MFYRHASQRAHKIVVKSTDSGATLPEFMSFLCHFLSLWPWTSWLASLDFHSFAYQMTIIIGRGCCEGIGHRVLWGLNTCEAFITWLCMKTVLMSVLLGAEMKDFQSPVAFSLKSHSCSLGEGLLSSAPMAPCTTPSIACIYLLVPPTFIKV